MQLISRLTIILLFFGMTGFEGDLSAGVKSSVPPKAVQSIRAPNGASIDRRISAVAIPEDIGTEPTPSIELTELDCARVLSPDYDRNLLPKIYHDRDVKIRLRSNESFTPLPMSARFECGDECSGASYLIDIVQLQSTSNEVPALEFLAHVPSFTECLSVKVSLNTGGQNQCALVTTDTKCVRGVVVGNPGSTPTQTTIPSSGANNLTTNSNPMNSGSATCVLDNHGVFNSMMLWIGLLSVAFLIRVRRSFRQTILKRG